MRHKRKMMARCWPPRKAVDSVEDDNLDNEDEGHKEEEVRRGRLWHRSYYILTFIVGRKVAKLTTRHIRSVVPTETLLFSINHSKLYVHLTPVQILM